MLKIARRVFYKIAMTEKCICRLCASCFEYEGTISSFHVEIRSNLRIRMLFLIKIHHVIFKNMYEVIDTLLPFGSSDSFGSDCIVLQLRLTFPLLC